MNRASHPSYFSSDIPFKEVPSTLLRPSAMAEQKLVENGFPVDAPLLSSKSPPQHYSLLCLVLPFLFPALGGFLYGYDIGATSVATLSIESSTRSGTNWYRLNSVEQGLVESGSQYGALVGSVLAFTVENCLGRRRQLMAASLLYIVGALVESLARSFTVLVIGRLIYGLGIGMTMHAAPLYIAETCPSSIRGRMISLKEVMIVLGMLVGYIAGYVEVNAIGGWRIMYIIAAPLSLIMGIGMWWLPPSPRWLFLCACEGSGDSERARLAASISLKRLRGSKVDQELIMVEVEETFESVKSIYAEQDTSFWELFKGKNLKALIIGVGLVFFQQFTGQPSVLYYAATVFQSAGFSAASNATLVSVILAAFKVIMTLLAVWKVDSIGRRPILVIGAAGLTISVFMLAIYYAFAHNAAILAVVALFLYVGFYQVSFGPITWLILSEIFPLRFRGRAMSIAVLLNFAGNAIVTFSFSLLQAAFGSAMPFWIFGVLGALSVIFIAVLVPETKGNSLEEIEAKL